MWYIGVGITCVACFLGALGDNLVRLSFVTEQEKGSGWERPLYKRPLWLAGMLCSVVLNAGLTIISLNFASAAIITPFAGLHIFWNVILARYVLRERVLFQHVFGSLLILLGLVFVLIFGIHDNPEYGLETLLKMYGQASFIVYSIFCSGLLGLCLYISCSPGPESAGSTVHKKSSPSHEALSSFDSDSGAIGPIELEGDVIGRAQASPEDSLDGDDCVTSEVTGKGGEVFRFWERVKGPNVSLGVKRFAVAATSGICGGNTNVIIQNVMKVFNTEGYTAVFNWQFIIVLITLGALATGQLVFLNSALAQFEAIYVVPMLNSVLIATGCIAGLALDPSSAHMPPLALLLFSTGTICIIWGIFVLSRADARRHQQEVATHSLEAIVMRSGELELGETINENKEQDGADGQTKSSMSAQLQAKVFAATVLTSNERSGSPSDKFEDEENVRYQFATMRVRKQKTGSKSKHDVYQPLSDSEEELDEPTYNTVLKYREEAKREESFT